MIRAFVSHDGNVLSLDLPHRGIPITRLLDGLDLPCQPWRLQAAGSAGVRVALTATDEMGAALLAKLDLHCPLVVLDKLCFEIRSACPGGRYRDLPQRVSASPSGEITGLIDIVRSAAREWSLPEPGQDAQPKEDT
ncbi:hypothetical protein [Lawsonibacter faecis]|uniref:Uncharacterized protein n=1 Tax=Lawsonibacter faecis TaxID=2763052 RepID=A0A8J6JK33_9FIRM|nr:hypothetical protein [Lawsonibacter faecis]MBC5737483.1 hypothetical protein [Lawsonibacter faecis]